MVEDESAFRRNFQEGIFDVRRWELGSSMESGDEGLFLIRSDELREKPDWGGSAQRTMRSRHYAYLWRTIGAVASNPPVFHSLCTHDVIPVGIQTVSYSGGK